MGNKKEKVFARVKVEKMHDKLFNNEHPKGINEGYVREGFMFRLPTVGERFEVWPGKLPRIGDIYSMFSTSPVTELQDGGVLHTGNSIYNVQVEKANDDGYPYWAPLAPADFAGTEA